MIKMSRQASPGFGVHDELAQLVKAGLTPAQALATATINPAEYFKVSADHGTIAAGKFADLLLLNKKSVRQHLKYPNHSNGCV